MGDISTSNKNMSPPRQMRKKIDQKEIPTDDDIEKFVMWYLVLTLYKTDNKIHGKITPKKKMILLNPICKLPMRMRSKFIGDHHLKFMHPDKESVRAAFGGGSCFSPPPPAVMSADA